MLEHISYFEFPEKKNLMKCINGYAYVYMDSVA